MTDSNEPALLAGNDNQETPRPLVLATADKSGDDVHESYAQLVWQRFRRSKISLVGVVMVMALAILAIFSAFFSPTDPGQIDLKNSFIPPQRVRFIDAEGNFHWRPFTYNQELTLDPKTYAPIWAEDTSKRYEIRFFVKGWEYRILGFVPMTIHLFGVEEGGSIYLLGTDKFGRDLWGRSCEAGRISLSLSLFAAFISIAIGSSIGVISGYYGGWTDNILQRLIEVLQSIPALPLWMALAAIVPITWSPLRVFMVMALIFALLSWTVLAREVRGKIMAFRETDFVMAAKEMGASDRRIIFNHLYPQSLSHIIVILTLAIPEIILAEAFLSFLGLGIQEPLISWGFLMRDAQNIETLGSHPWIMTPAIFIVVAVLGFNFLGDGLRDAADPYSIV